MSIKKLFEALIAFMIHFGIVFIFSTWVFEKMVFYKAPEYIAFMFSLWIFATGMKMFKLHIQPMSAAEMRKELNELKAMREEVEKLDLDKDLEPEKGDN